MYVHKQGSVSATDFKQWMTRKVDNLTAEEIAFLYNMGYVYMYVCVCDVYVVCVCYVCGM